MSDLLCPFWSPCYTAKQNAQKERKPLVAGCFHARSGAFNIVMSARRLTKISPDAPSPKPQASPRPHKFAFEGRTFSLQWEPSGWRLRSKSKAFPVDHRTGTTNTKEAERVAREWLRKKADDPIHSRKGGGTLEGLVAVYLGAPKRTTRKSAEGNVSRLRTICRAVLGKELGKVTCREIGPEFWQTYQRIATEAKGYTFDLATRRPENAAINAAVRSARVLFHKGMLPHYRAACLDVRPDASYATDLPVPYMPPVSFDDAALVAKWEALRDSDLRLWLAIGLARFAGMRRAEIIACRGGWIEERGESVAIVLRDRPEEAFWSKTGRVYRAVIIHPLLAAHLREAAKSPASLVVPGSPDPKERLAWFGRYPQSWLRDCGISSRKPLHRLRGAYADAVASLTADAVAARLAGVKAAQEALGHTSSATTERHYLSVET